MSTTPSASPRRQLIHKISSPKSRTTSSLPLPLPPSFDMFARNLDQDLASHGRTKSYGRYTTSVLPSDEKAKSNNIPYIEPLNFEAPEPYTRTFMSWNDTAKITLNENNHLFGNGPAASSNDVPKTNESKDEPLPPSKTNDSAITSRDYTLEDAICARKAYTTAYRPQAEIVKLEGETLVVRSQTGPATSTLLQVPFSLVRDRTLGPYRGAISTRKEAIALMSEPQFRQRLYNAVTWVTHQSDNIDTTGYNSADSIRLKNRIPLVPAGRWPLDHASKNEHFEPHPFTKRPPTNSLFGDAPLSLTSKAVFDKLTRRDADEESNRGYFPRLTTPGAMSLIRRPLPNNEKCHYTSIGKPLSVHFLSSFGASKIHTNSHFHSIHLQPQRSLPPKPLCNPCP